MRPSILIATVTRPQRSDRHLFLDQYAALKYTYRLLADPKTHVFRTRVRALAMYVSR